MEAIETSKHCKPDDCMLDLLGRWTSNQTGTGTLPRTWQTVVEAVRKTGFGAFAKGRKLSTQAWTDSVTVTVCYLATVSYTADDIVTCSCH